MKTVAIVGSHPSTRDQAPFNNPDVDIWVFNAGAIMEWCKRATAVFEIHPAGEYTNPLNEKSEYWQEFLQKQTVATVYMQKKDPRVPMAVAFPLEKIIEKYLNNFRRGKKVNRYFTSSICYALAMAILLGYKRIEIYGVEMETNSEYIYQRDGVGLWVGIALGRGVQVHLAEHTSMFQSPLYGYDDEHNVISREDFEENANLLQKVFEERKTQLEGAKARLDVTIQTIEKKRVKNDMEAVKKLGDDYGKYIGEYEQALADFADANGQLKLCRFYLGKIEKMMAANGNAQAVMALRGTKIRATGIAI